MTTLFWILTSFWLLISPNSVSQPRLGAERFEAYLPALKGKRVAVVVNHTALVGKTHLVDTLKSLGVQVVKIFAPEHGFRGKADAGEYIQNQTDKPTGLPVVSLYGQKNKKPTTEQLQDVDVVLFDIQDVGVRFYTYISTMHYVMEACAEQQKLLWVLDRPNPNGGYIDGNIREEKFKSFVGMHPIPIVHGLTVGELALMINGEKWLEKGLQCPLQVVKMENYHHNLAYSLPTKPSPNLPNDLSIQLYASLCLFEGTTISVGRGTAFPFQVLGAPDKAYGSFSFIPQSIEGMAKNPMYQDLACYGVDLRESGFQGKFTLQYLLDFYQKCPDKTKFFNGYFDTIAGSTLLKQQIMAGMTEKQIRKTWQKDLEAYKQTRKKYLLYE
jgi:uncharacterized protein YbbC (DUF1343 family)